MLPTHESSESFSNNTFSNTSFHSSLKTSSATSVCHSNAAASPLTSVHTSNTLPPALHNVLTKRLKQLLSEPELLQKHLYSRLISAEDSCLAQKRPLLPMADLALVYELRFTRDEFPEAFTMPPFESPLSDGNAAFSLSIDHTILKAMNMSPSELFTATARTMQQRHPAQISSMEEVLGFPVPAEPVLVVITNAESHHGAGAILYDGVAEQVAAILEDFFILPSSIHEVLAVRRSARLSIAELKKLVQNVNQQEVVPEERLSNHVYKLIKNPDKNSASPAYILAYADDYDLDIQNSEKEVLT